MIFSDILLGMSFTLKTTPISKKYVNLMSAVMVSALLAGCSSFQGPGPLVMGGNREPAQENQVGVQGDYQSPQLTLVGAQQALGTSDVQFDWPVDQARLTRGFFAKSAKKKRPHWGLDLANKKNTPIMASTEGKVIYTGTGFHGYGKLIVIEHGADWATLYGHLNKILVKEGQTVSRGDQIGLMGRTGHADGNHLHFEIRHFRQPVNPLAFLPEGTLPGRANAIYVGPSGSGPLRLSQQVKQSSLQGSSAAE